MAGRLKTRRSRWSCHYRYGRRTSAASTQAGGAVAHNGRSDNTPETAAYHRASAGSAEKAGLLKAAVLKPACAAVSCAA